MSVWFPGVILWHVTCPKLCRALQEASHFTCLWPVNIWLCCTRYHQSSSRSVVPRIRLSSSCVQWGSGKKAVRRALGRIVFVCQYCALLPIFLLCFPSSLALHHWDFSPVHPSHAGIQCRCCQFQVVDGRMLRRSTNVICSVRSCHIWHGRLHIRLN